MAVFSNLWPGHFLTIKQQLPEKPTLKLFKKKSTKYINKCQSNATNSITMQSLITFTILSTMAISYNIQVCVSLEFDLDSIHMPSETLHKRQEEQNQRNRLSNWLESLERQAASNPELTRRALLYQTLGTRANNLLKRAPHMDGEGRPIPELKARVHKRHCWDVADICCMWDVC